MPVIRPLGLRISFFGMVSAVMVALKLKEHMDGRPQDEEGRVALHEPPRYRDEPSEDDEENATLLRLDTELPARRPRTRRIGCCTCCPNVGLFCKALGIVTLVFTVYGAFKLIVWAVSPTPTGLENLPAFSESLGCRNAPHLYNGGNVSIRVPFGTHDSFDHTLDVRGESVGTITIAEAVSNANEVEYTMTLRSTDESVLQSVKLEYLSKDESADVEESRMSIYTGSSSSAGNQNDCVRYDITMHIPPGLKSLSVKSHTLTHVQFSPGAEIALNNLHVTLFAQNEHNLILPHQNIRANKLALEVYRGWIVGDASIVNQTSITTQRGDGIAHVRVYPTPPIDVTQPDPCELQTTTGAGRTDIIFTSDKTSIHRPIKAVHMASQSGDVYLTYRDAGFSGRISLDSSSFTAIGLHPFTDKTPAEKDDEVEQGTKWTHWVGDKDGKDRIFVKSRSWTGLYF
ncbi:hypothetical protein L218DRAFT_926655 [Marasmius fiardii PR-910]|nr:hypothetical protein L218DRAFT_926655 [Marasmius fiardii PR-910]